MYKIYNLDSPWGWNNGLKCVSRLDVFYHWGYCKLFENERKEQAKLLVCQTEEGDLIYPFFLRSINRLPVFSGKLSHDYFDVVSPYGYGGPLCSNPKNKKAIEIFHDIWCSYCRENNIVTEFIRFHPMMENHSYPWLSDLKVEKAKKIVAVDLTQTESEIWSAYQYNNRKNINRGVREKLQVAIEENPEHLKDFQKIYAHTMERRHAAFQYSFSEMFFSRIHSYLKGNYAFAYAMKDKEIISAELLLFNEVYIHSFLGGTLSQFFSSRPNNLLKHQIILWAKSKGIKYLLLGGGYEEDDGIFKYKLSFAPEGVRDFYVGKRIINQEAVDFLEKLREKGDMNQDADIRIKNQFFPSYREGVG